MAKSLDNILEIEKEQYGVKSRSDLIQRILSLYISIYDSNHPYREFVKRVEKVQTGTGTSNKFKSKLTTVPRDKSSAEFEKNKRNVQELKEFFDKVGPKNVRALLKGKEKQRTKKGDPNTRFDFLLDTLMREDELPGLLQAVVDKIALTELRKEKGAGAQLPD